MNHLLAPESANKKMRAARLRFTRVEDLDVQPEEIVKAEPARPYRIID